MVMDSRTQFILQLLQKLGAPLMGAVNAHSQGQEQDAQTLAALLSESVKISISLSQAMNLKADDGDSDAIRVSLATLAAGLIADSYTQHGRIPGEQESRRISKALESVIVFADNFAPAAEHAKRLQTLDDAPPFIDPVQTNVYAMNALIPAIIVISEFSFGQPAPRLIQDVSERLGAKAKELVGALGAGASAMGEMVVLQALGKIYASAHRMETERLKGTDGTNAATIDGVWKSFDTQVSMVDVLLKPMGGSGAASGSGSSGGVKPSPPPAATDAAPPPAPPAAPPASETPPAAPAAAGNPMAFFKKK